MNLLVPNARNAQAHVLIRSLRRRASRIVALAEGRNRIECWAAHAAHGPGVDRRVATPWPASDWERGHHPRENTPAEARYMACVEALCREERLDTIFPSVEGTIYVLAKNGSRLRSRGIDLVAPPLDVVTGVNDKYRSMVRLQDTEVPVPRTLLPGPTSIRAAAAALGFPLVVKPRHASASRGVHVVSDLAGLETAYRSVAGRYGPPVVQEYVPGPLDGGFLRIIGVADAGGAILASHVCRTLLTVFADRVLPPAVARSESNPELVATAQAVVKRLRIIGPFLLQFKIDARDGLPKLIEVNCKVSYRAWTAVADGVDVPDLAVRARAPTGGPPPAPGRVGTVFVNVPELLLARCLDPGRARAVAGIIRHGPRVIDPYSADFFRAPRVAVLWWTTFLGFSLRERLARRASRPV